MLLRTTRWNHWTKFSGIARSGRRGDPRADERDRTKSFLHAVKELTHKGALLIFDETITGFRFAKGGPRSCSAWPDLATFGKGLANGYPLSAVAGRAEVMHLMEEIFFSFTFGGKPFRLPHRSRP